MVDGRQQTTLAIEAGEGVGVGGDIRWQNLQRHVAPELQVTGAIHDAHSTDADDRDDLVVTETAPDIQSHNGNPL